MQELIDRVVQNVGIDPSVAQPAIGMILKLIQSVVPQETMSSLMGVLPGADALIGAADQSESSGGGGGLGGMLGSAMGALTGGGGAAALTQALGQLQGLGLDTDQAKSVGTEVLGFIKEKAPAEVTSAIEENVPGL